MGERIVTEGYVSLEKAKEDYGVLLDPETMKVGEKYGRKPASGFLPF